ncbi:MAG TPA: maleylpyruvate isomerase family mycothiol-dependent enzyme [Propionicimonas sp.]|nr:maleylpyruvate isomerase family mycothiol-dependent enzyme [Propionicimonas sp.]
MTHYTGSVPVEDLHRWKPEATQRLLGYTIGISDEEWHQPSPLPGWSRAHLATHLARNAEHLRLIAEAVDAGLPQPVAPSRAERLAELERGADRGGMELQIDLDTSAGALQQAIERITHWDAVVRLRGRDWPLAAVPLARLHEVCVHHIDLDCEFGPDAIDPAAAAWLLRWVLDLLTDADLPALRIEADSLVAELGTGPDVRTVTGSDARLWAWLSGRLPASGVAGADGLQPSLLS